MNLSQAIRSIQYNSCWEIWATVPFTPESEARYGQCQLEQGGLLDDKVFFADGVEVGDYMLQYSDGDDESSENDDWVAEAAELMIEWYEDTRD